MIPMLITVEYRRAGGRRRRIHVPVLLVVLVLSPLLPLALIAATIACVVFRVNTIGALRATGRVLWSLPGTRIEVEDGRTPFSISVI